MSNSGDRDTRSIAVMQELRQMEFYILRASIATVQVGWEHGGSALNQVLAYMAVPSFAGGG